MILKSYQHKWLSGFIRHAKNYKTLGVYSGVLSHFIPFLNFLPVYIYSQNGKKVTLFLKLFSKKIKYYFYLFDIQNIMEIFFEGIFLGFLKIS